MKETHFPSVMQQFFELSQNSIALLKAMGNLVITEAQLAKKSLKIIFFLLVVQFIFILSTWICILATLFFWLSSEGLSILLSLSILSLFNLLLLVSIKYLLAFYRNNLRFNRTKKHLLSLKETSHDEFGKKASNL